MTGIRKSPQIFYFRKCRSCFAKRQVLFICLAKYNKYHIAIIQLKSIKILLNLSMTMKLKEQEYHCPLCIEEGNDKTYTLSEMEGDHITPWSEGGKTEYDNLQMLCKRHNRLKSNH